MVLSLALPIFAQQTGDANRDYLINGNGSGGTSPVVHTVNIQNSFGQEYFTLDPGAPVFLASSGWVDPGALVVSPSNSVDLNLTFFQIVASGLDGSFLSSFFWTDGAGSLHLYTSVSPYFAGVTRAVQMAHIAASSPDGFWVSQAHQVTFFIPLACTFPGTNIGAGDDTSTNEPLGFSFIFYGTTYTDLFIGSNGYITFGASDTTFTENVPDFLNGPPRIAIWWDDLSPNQAGSVNFFTNNADTAEVCFLGVPEFISTGANSFHAILNGAGNWINMDYDTAMTSMDGLVGLSPGNGVDPTGLGLDLTGVGGNPLGFGINAPFELFTSTNFMDLPGQHLSWTLDPSGNPFFQNN